MQTGVNVVLIALHAVCKCCIIRYTAILLTRNVFLCKALAVNAELIR